MGSPPPEQILCTSGGDAEERYMSQVPHIETQRDSPSFGMTIICGSPSHLFTMNSLFIIS